MSDQAWEGLILAAVEQWNLQAARLLLRHWKSEPLTVINGPKEG